MTELKSETKGLGDNYDIRIFGMTRPRGSINKAIDERVDKMLRSGLLAEVKRLKKRRLSRTAAAALGLKEISRHLDGECDLDEARAELKMNTRRFAKRQMTWFGADGRIVWFDMSRTGESKAVSEIAAQVKELKM
jgi:tRNA dimethylallyltransferase